MMNADRSSMPHIEQVGGFRCAANTIRERMQIAGLAPSLKPKHMRMRRRHP
jgi:hypothetical protein